MSTAERYAIAMAELPEIMCVDDVAKYLRIGRGTAYELARRNDFPSFRIGNVRGVRVNRDEFLGWVRGQSAK